MKEQFQDKPQERIRSALFAKYYPADGGGKRPLSATIHRAEVSEVFNILKDIHNFPQFFENLKKIESAPGGATNWYFKSPSATAGDDFSIPMQVEYDQNNNGLVWHSEDKAGFKYSVAIELAVAPAQRGTVVRMMVAYDNLLGEIAGKFERLFGKDAEIISKKNLLRLKAFCETGSVPTTEGQPSGRDEDLVPELKH